MVKELSDSLGVPAIIAELLLQRGIKSFDEARDFFRPNLNMLHDPFLMKDMANAVVRIEQAIINKESILIFGDYDVDGTTAVALVYSFFKDFAQQIEYYIPDRYKEGYGVSQQSIDYAYEKGISLIIALDCGIKSVDLVKDAKEKGIDFIICDHHRPGNVLPDAVAILDPKRADCTYPFDELSGCGIGFKLMQAFIIHNNLFPNKINEKLTEYLDLVAVSIAADIVPITGENRILAHAGLLQLNTHKREGFKAIIELLKLNKELSISDIVFSIAPRINAAGRLDSGSKAVELLVSSTSELAAFSGKNIDETNSERKNIDQSITQQALAMIEQSKTHTHKKSTVLFHKDWHKGVVGIVASRLTEKYYRPTIVLTESNGEATGSARSVKDFDVYNALEACRDLIKHFGGHKYAAGLTLDISNVEAFQNRFEEVVAASITDDMLIPEIDVDLTLQLDEIDAKLVRIIKQFAPFGPGNMTPVFYATKVKHHGNLRKVGTKHLKMDVKNDKMDRFIPAIAFNMEHHFERLLHFNEFEMCYSIEENEFNGLTFLQLNVKDIKVTETSFQP